MHVQFIQSAMRYTCTYRYTASFSPSLLVFLSLFLFLISTASVRAIHVHGKYVYSTLALGKEREIVKEETALRKEKEAVCCYVHVDVHV